MSVRPPEQSRWLTGRERPRAIVAVSMWSGWKKWTAESSARGSLLNQSKIRKSCWAAWAMGNARWFVSYSIGQGWGEARKAPRMWILRKQLFSELERSLLKFAPLALPWPWPWPWATGCIYLTGSMILSAASWKTSSQYVSIIILMSTYPSAPWDRDAARLRRQPFPQTWEAWQNLPLKTQPHIPNLYGPRLLEEPWLPLLSPDGVPKRAWLVQCLPPTKAGCSHKSLVPLDG